MSILLIDKISSKNNKINYNLQPSVTVMIVAHNEEKVIEKKLNIFKKINYPKDKIKFIIASDNSTDATIINNITICSNVLIGAGSLVLNDIDIQGVHYGHPIITELIN